MSQDSDGSEVYDLVYYPKYGKEFTLNYQITGISKEEMPLLIEWAKREGWNPGLNDASCFYQADPHGFFAGRLDGKIIATGSAVVYDDAFAFCGLYIVDAPYRGQGYGLTLTMARLAYAGDRNVGLDGVISMLSTYAKLGYQVAYNNARWCGKHFPALRAQNPHIVPLSQPDFATVSDYDRLHFPARREAFLTCWINQPGATSLAYVAEGELQGYAVMRPCYEGFKIGPLFADTPDIADALFLHLTAYAKGQQIMLDLPETNQHALAMAKRYQMEKVFATARMYLKSVPDVRMDGIYGITTFELG
jgi:GNAT superfamily N-acetyltransferase